MSSFCLSLATCKRIRVCIGMYTILCILNNRYLVDKLLQTDSEVQGLSASMPASNIHNGGSSSSDESGYCIGFFFSPFISTIMTTKLQIKFS